MGLQLGARHLAKEPALLSPNPKWKKNTDGFALCVTWKSLPVEAATFCGTTRTITCDIATKEKTCLKFPH